MAKFNFQRFQSPIFYIVLIMALGFALRYFFLNTQTQDGGKQSTQTLFAASFPNENGQQKDLSQYKGKIVVLNFWATWCEPCREEMPELSLLHDAYKNKNVVVLGIAIDDVAAINAFAKETKVSYPLFAADVQGMDIATNLGNNKGVLPYTVIIKADGSLGKTYFGRITKPLIENNLLPLLK
jgi:thiol-disulfide isomerase/thioredoxin